ncbi:MAG: hypothetical protein CML60_10300 [Rhodobacteraceae bacterium]|nr:hypothetical protein [Paracoccaceae bacterium]
MAIGVGERRGKGVYLVRVLLFVVFLNSLMLLAQHDRSECKARIDKVSGAEKSEWGRFVVSYICQRPVDLVFLLLQMHGREPDTERRRRTERREKVGWHMTMEGYVTVRTYVTG